MDRLKKIGKKILPYFIILLFAFLLAEIVFWLGGKYTGHSVELFGKYHIHTGYPMSYWDSCFATYTNPKLVKSEKAYGQYDLDLGWSIAPNKVGKNGLYRSNSQGIRADREYTQLPDSGVIRIAVFGDSFTHGNEVDNSQTWPAQLEQVLRAKGYEVEVMNFGVMSYGTDQAFLRWERDGKPFKPHLVIMGIQMENIFRNVNVFRPCYIPQAGIALSKPRAIYNNKKLKWVNQPTVHPKKLKKVVQDFENSNLAKYEYYSDTRLVKNSWVDWSYTLVVLRHIMSDEKKNRTNIKSFYSALKLHKKILREFKLSVEDAGAEMLSVQLPTKADLNQYRKKKRLDYDKELLAINALFKVIRTEEAFNNYALKDIFQPHYTEKGNAIIAKTVAGEVEKTRSFSWGSKLMKRISESDGLIEMSVDSVGIGTISIDGDSAARAVPISTQ